MPKVTRRRAEAAMDLTWEAGFDEGMTTVDWPRAAELAGHAPSIHNTQPWRFVVDGELVQLWADRDRAVPVIDPTGRQLALSCGAALEQFRIALADQGRDTHIELSPEPGSPDLLAVIRLSDGAPDPADAALSPWITRRATVRAAFESRAVPPEVVDRFHQEVGSVGAWLRPLVDRQDLIALSVLLSHADEAQRTDSGYREELESWRRHGESPDGVPDSALQSSAGRHSEVALRDFGLPDGTASDVVAGDERPIDERPLIVVLGTEHDGVHDWLVAGRGLARLLLTAAAEGVVASPLNQVIDDPAPRQQLRAQLGLLGQPQMVLRMGYGEAAPSTGRRPVSEYLVVR